MGRPVQDHPSVDVWSAATSTFGGRRLGVTVGGACEMQTRVATGHGNNPDIVRGPRNWAHVGSGAGAASGG